MKTVKRIGGGECFWGKNKSYREIITFRYLKTSFVKKKKKQKKQKQI